MTVTAVSPPGGGLSGGTVVTVSGAGFEVGAIVTFGGMATHVSVNSSTTIVATTPPHGEGAVDVVVINPDGRRGVLTSGYAYGRGIPAASFAVRRMTPQPGSTAGGSSVTIESVGVQSGARVSIGGLAMAATFFAGTLYLITPPHAAGTVDVVVTNPDGTSSSLPGGYTYAPPATFDFNGVWEAGAHETPIRFTIRDNTLVSLSCGGAEADLARPLPAVTDGEFRVAKSDSLIATGRIVSASAATGRIDLGPCPGVEWYAVKQ
jgi:hypothetical protein